MSSPSSSLPPQISLGFDDTIVPGQEQVLVSDVLVDRGSRYGYGFARVEGKEGIKTFLRHIRSTKPFDSADHCSYAFRIRSPEGVLVEGK